MSARTPDTRPGAEVAPTLADPGARAGAEVLGGPAGQHRARGSSFWTPLRVILAVGTVVYWLGFLRTYPCLSNGWVDPDRYEAMCYSDVPVLYSLRGIADGLLPYFDTPADGQPLEYPVGIGAVMWLLGRVTVLLTGGSPDATVYYLVTAFVMFACFVVTIVATAWTVRGRTWDALMVAAAPAVFLASFVNWDLVAVALTGLYFWAWARSRLVVAGVVLGLAIAVKFYPIVLLGPLLVLCLRARRLTAWVAVAGVAAAVWLVVNLPVMLAAFDGWKTFFTFSSERGPDFGSVWMALDLWGRPVAAGDVNLLGVGVLVLLCAVIAGVILLAPRRPRLAQVSFLVVAAFVVTNKVYSPQFVLWLLPLAVLARPRWRDVLGWQLAEAVYFAAIWWYLVGYTEGAKGLPDRWYAAAIAVHVIATLAFAALVVRDIWRPDHDPVRGSGHPGHEDDPGGGVLDGAADWLGGPKRHAAG